MSIIKTNHLIKFNEIFIVQSEIHENTRTGNIPWTVGRVTGTYLISVVSTYSSDTNGVSAG